MGSYRPDTCAWCGAETWCETRANGKPQCRGCKVERFFEQVLYPPLGIALMPWQRRTLRELYGTVTPEDGRRKYRNAYLSVAKQNGKTWMLGGLPLYHLTVEHEFNPEAYGCAAAKDQAGLVFKAAQMLVDANPALRKALRVLPSSKRILRRDGPGFYQVLSADGDVQDGIRPSLLIRDELHRWRSAKAETLRDVTTRGQISRDEPLDIVTTTAGAEYESPLWWGEYQFARQVAEGGIKSDSFYAAIWAADKRRIEEDPEYWKSREARVAANPSHEDLGGFLKDKSIAAEMEKAIASPAERSKYLRYHLNIPITSFEDPVIEMPKWRACSGGVELEQWPEYDAELLISKWGLVDRPCWAGVDASWTTDLTAVVFVFPPFGDSESWTLLPFFWVPREKVPHLERVCRAPFSDWVRRGFVSATPGNGIDMRAVKERIHWGRQLFELREVDYDRCNFRTQAMELGDEGIDVIEVQQAFLHLSHPTKALLSLYPDGKLRHGNHPVLNWMAGCLQLQYDHKDNCQPIKPERLKSTKRIDGIAATVTALSRALVGESKTYTYSGLRSVGA